MPNLLFIDTETKKTFDNVDDLQNIKEEWKTGPAGILVPPDMKFDVKKEDGIWFDSYVMNTNLDLRLDRVDLPGLNLSGSPKQLAERYVRQADIRFNLTVPTGVFVEDGTGLDVRYIMAVRTLPAGFDRVASIHPEPPDRVTLEAASGRRVQAPLDLGFLEP